MHSLDQFQNTTNYDIILRYSKEAIYIKIEYITFIILKKNFKVLRI